ncbi:hypothetical protein DFJ73DRAFT_878008 [Zopfochytrium polystomum]|nr:hypothetical protein DFJ73DRAFT_878008 [Zopfochytrium polystomum]
MTEQPTAAAPVDTAPAPSATTTASHTPAALRDLLATTTCGDLVKHNTIISRDPSRPKVPICLDVELTVQEGCAALAQHRISSAPVYSPEAGGFIGMLDYKDLVAFVLEVFHKVPKETNQHNYDAEMEITDIVKRANVDKHSVPIRLVTNLSHRNPLIAVYSTSSAVAAIEQFVRHRVHRLVVLERADQGSPDPKSKFIGVLSQSAIAALVVEQFGRLHHGPNSKNDAAKEAWDVGNMTLAELGLVKGEVYSVVANDTVLDALYLMHEKGVTSVAVVDKSNGTPKLTGSISMTDIKEILSTRGGWRRLYEPAFRFFVSLRNQQGLEANGADRVPSFTVHPGTPLMVALEKMTATRTHRVWIVNDYHTVGGGGVSSASVGDLVGVLSLSDVMPLLLVAVGGSAEVQATNEEQA